MSIFNGFFGIMRQKQPLHRKDMNALFSSGYIDMNSVENQLTPTYQQFLTFSFPDVFKLRLLP